MKTQSWFKPYFDRLSSMSLAIALLTVLALASAIGTVLKQNQDQADYLTQFGALWYNVFVSLGLFTLLFVLLLWIRLDLERSRTTLDGLVVIATEDSNRASRN